MWTAKPLGAKAHRFKNIWLAVLTVNALGFVAEMSANVQCDTWAEIGGAQAIVEALAVHNEDLVAGGWFTTINDIPANRIARWDGSQWNPLGMGVNWSAFPENTTVLALESWNGQLVAAGRFDEAGGQPANHIAVWNGVSWSALGGGMSAVVLTLATHKGDLIAGGPFIFAGGQSANRIAAWDGSHWRALGTGMDDNVLALLSYNDVLVAGGHFLTAGGVLVNRIARWDGTSWHALGQGANGSITVLGEYNGDLIAAGLFTEVSGVSANRIARWDGSEWHPLGSGLTGNIEAMGVYNGFLVVAVGGPNKIARWNGSEWKEISFPVGWPLSLVSYEAAVTVAVHNGRITSWEDCPPNQRPEFGFDSAPFRVISGEDFEFTFTVSDPDGDNLEISTSTLPPGAVLAPTAGTSPLTATFSWTPSTADLGSYTIYVTATDEHGASSEGLFKIHVVTRRGNTITGRLWRVTEERAANAIPENVPNWEPDVVFDVVSPFSFSAPVGVPLSKWLASAGARIQDDGVVLKVPDLVIGTEPFMIEFTGYAHMQTGEGFFVRHDDGATLIIDGINMGLPPDDLRASHLVWQGDSGLLPFQLVYGERGGGADLAVELHLGNLDSRGPILNPATGHYYDAIPIPRGITWVEARAFAEGWGGYLATITSTWEGENDFVHWNFPEASQEDFWGYWIGGFQPGDTGESDPDPAAGWEWVTGEPFVDSLWYADEPNDHGGAEDAIHFWAQTGAWNDLPRWALLGGFVIEYNHYPGDSDGDGLLDADEDIIGTNPNNPDSDGDGLLDGTEVEMACADPLNADSDGDGLSDGHEVNVLGTDPCSADTDGDGVPDGIDPLPLESGVTQSFVEERLHDQANEIGEIDLSLFTGSNANSNSGRQNSLSNRLRNAAKAIAQGDIATAIEILEGILAKIDSDEADPDWLADSREKSALVAEIQLLLSLVAVAADNDEDIVFVSHRLGDDSNRGTRLQPVASIERGIQIASYNSPKKKVYVATGTYHMSQSLQIVSGVSVYGSFDPSSDWTRTSVVSSRLETDSTTAVIARGLTETTHLESFQIVPAPGRLDDPSSYGIRVLHGSAPLVLRFNEVRAGAGFPGAHGSHGVKGADGGPGGNGGPGGCDSDWGGYGGLAGLSWCGRPGGGGGKGGDEGQHGTAGQAGVIETPGGRGGLSGNPGKPGEKGTDGIGGHAGNNGLAAPGVLRILNDVYAPPEATQGFPGTPGNGGGGGGGGGGQAGWFVIDGAGNGGGGGGGGGCGGSPGGSGESGGGSFGIFVVSGQALVEQNVLVSAGGGRGGNGGHGGRGGLGGAPGLGNTICTSEVGAGGNGGRGGDGGPGGSGAGGTGGPSICLFFTAGSPVTVNANLFENGAGGFGGRGGSNGMSIAPSGDHGLSRTIYSTTSY